METTTTKRPDHLAWHETLEIHELVSLQSTAIMKMKKFISEVKDSTLHGIYEAAINDLEKNVRELLQFYKMAPRNDEEEEEENFRDVGTGFYVSELLSFSKTAVKSYAAAITETATPELREVLTNHLADAIGLHARVFMFMFENGLYPAYDLQKLLQNDIKNAEKALKMS